MKLYNENNMEALKWIPDNSVDSIVTDPPYGLSFMNKKWDHDVPSVEFWRQVYRVLKPGGHILSFGGTRTYHRMAVAIEDAGFEIRDQIMWLYGSGFPKSYNISKGIDKKFGIEREVVPQIRTDGTSRKSANPGKTSWKNTSKKIGQTPLMKNSHPKAKQWDGFGTALKPANEPIVLARKPLSEKNIVDNVLKWGTGGLNIDGCRVGTESTRRTNGKTAIWSAGGMDSKQGGSDSGRFPANIILDEVAGELLDEQSGQNCSRFFYCTKASKSERNAGVETNNHPTVKPTKLMQYLVRLVTPPNGTVLDPFMGSGSTGIACVNESFDFIGIEMDKDYFDIASKRIEGAKK
jgi:DNA modification methylase